MDFNMKLNVRKLIAFIISVSSGVLVIIAGVAFNWPGNIFVPASSLVGFLVWWAFDLLMKRA